MRKRTKDFDLPPRCSRLPSGSVRFRPLGGQSVILGTRHDSLSDIWARHRTITEQSNANTLSWVADQWYKSHNFITLKPRTQQDYRKDCSKKPIQAFRGWDVSIIKPSDIHRYMEARAVASIRRTNLELTWLRHVLGFAVHLGVIPSNPCRDIKPLRDRPKKRPYVSDFTYMGMYAKSSATVRVAMEICYCTGIRQGDVLKLRWDEIDDAMYIKEGKTDNEYMKLISPRLRLALDAAKKLPGQRFGGWVIRNSKGNRYTSKGFQANWKRAKAKLPKHRQFRFHDIRHKAITDSKEDKQLFSMHSDAKMLGLYDHELTVSPSH